MGRVYASRFGRVPDWLLDADVSDRAIRLYAKLTRYADREDRARPTRPQLARDLKGCSVKSIDRALDELDEVGALTIEPRFDEAGDRTSNDYLLHDKPFGGRDTGVATPAKETPGQWGVGTPVSPPRDTGVATGRDTGVPSRSLEAESQLEREKTLFVVGGAADTEPEPPSAPPEHPEARRLCDLLADAIKVNTGERPNVGKRWLDAARLLLDRDGYTVEQVEYLIRWSQADEFWRSNILSMSKLREKRLTLIARAKESSARRRAQGPAARAGDFHAYETSGRVAL